MAVDWSRLPRRALLTFFQKEQLYSYCEGREVFAWNAATSVWVPVAERVIEQIDRVIFHDTTAARGSDFLLGFNVIDNGAGSKFERFPEKPTDLLSTAIRCFLQAQVDFQNEPTIGEMVSIYVRFDRETMLSFW